MVIKDYDQLIDMVKNAPSVKIAVAAAADQHTVEAACYAYKENIIEPIFIGDREKILFYVKEQGFKENQFEIIDEKDVFMTPYIASKLVHEGRASIVMKGFIDTSDFLRGILDKKDGLRTGNPMSHMAFLQLKDYHKLLVITDGGMITEPDYETKKRILENTNGILKGIGYDRPKVAVLTAVEKPNKSMPETMEARMLQIECEEGTIDDCDIEGPVSYDIAISKKSAEMKGFTGKYSGDYDIWLMPNISAGNMVSKALICNAGAKMAGIVAGAKVPLVLNSRSSTAQEKYYAIVLAAASRINNI